MPYPQGYLTNFQKLSFSLKEEEAGYCGWKFQVHRHFGFPIATLQLFQYPENVKFQFLALHSPGRNAISPEVFNEFSKTFFRWKKSKVAIVVGSFKCTLKEEEAGYLWLKIWSTQTFLFCIATLQFFQHPENVKISFLPLPSAGRNAISPEVFNQFLKTFSPERRGRWLLLLKISSAQTFWFSNNNVKTFPTSRKCKNFNFSLYTVPAELLYLQKYLTNFQKLFFGWKKRNVAIVVKNFKCTDILVFQ